MQMIDRLLQRINFDNVFALFVGENDIIKNWTFYIFQTIFNIVDECIRANFTNFEATFSELKLF